MLTAWRRATPTHAHAQVSTACRLIDQTGSPSAAFADCFDQAEHGVAERVLMKDLAAGDFVLSSESEVRRVLIRMDHPHALRSLSSGSGLATAGYSVRPEARSRAKRVVQHSRSTFCRLCCLCCFQALLWPRPLAYTYTADDARHREPARDLGAYVADA